MLQALIQIIRLKTNGLDKYNKFTGSNYTLEGLTKNYFTKKVAAEDKLRAETKKLKKLFLKTHPESIELEAQKKTRTLPKGWMEMELAGSIKMR